MSEDIEESVITFNNVNKIYDNGMEQVKALNNVNIEFADTGMVFILGKSGSGKTTLLNMITGLDSCNEGKVVINHEDWSIKTEKDCDKFRSKNIGIVFQEYNLIDDLNVYYNVEFPLKLLQMTKEERNKKVLNALKYVGMEELANRRITELSGGQRQRVAIARAIVKNPKIIVADEPTGNLDERTTESIFKLLKNISKDCLVIVVTHDVDSAQKFADSIFNIADGRVEGGNICKEHCYEAKIIDKKKHNQIRVWDCNKEVVFQKIRELMSNTLESEMECSMLINVKMMYDVEENEAYIHREEKENIDSNHIADELNTIRLINRDILDYAINIINCRIIRFLVTLVMFTLTTALFGITIILTSFQSDVTILNYLKQYNVKYHAVGKNVGYKNAFAVQLDKLLMSGNLVHDELYDNFQKERIESRRYNMKIYYMEDNEYIIEPTDITIAFLENNNSRQKCLKGKMPSKANEIALTDYLCHELELGEEVVGQKICVEGNEMTITGIVQTDYMEYNILEKIASGMLSEFAHYKIQYEYNVGYADKSYVEERKEERLCLQLTAGNFFISNKVVSYLEQRLGYCSAKYITSEDIIVGRMPERENEIVISTTTVTNYGLDINTVCGSQYTFRNIYDEIYGLYYDDYLNLYDYFPNGIEIVGVYSIDRIYDETVLMSDVLLQTDIFDTIQTDYYNLHYYDEYMVYTSEKYYQEDIELFRKLGYTMQEPSIKKINKFDRTIMDNKIYLWAILAVLMIITVFMFISSITFSIRDNMKKIGIFRAIGVDRWDTLKIFIFEALLLELTGIVIAVILCCISVTQINKIYMIQLLENKFELLFINWQILGMVLLIVFVIGLLTAIIPIYRFSKIKPIYLLNNKG